MVNGRTFLILSGTVRAEGTVVSLKRTLKGYDAYMGRVQYRLIPLLW
jgi:hypothetical protein